MTLRKRLGCPSEQYFQMVLLTDDISLAAHFLRKATLVGERRQRSSGPHDDSSNLR